MQNEMRAAQLIHFCRFSCERAMRYGVFIASIGISKYDDCTDTFPLPLTANTLLLMMIGWCKSN